MRWEEIKTKEQLNAKFCFLAPKHNYINSARYYCMVLIKSFCQAILVGEKAWKPFSLRGTWDLTTGGGGCSCYCRGTSGGSKWVSEAEAWYHEITEQWKRCWSRQLGEDTGWGGWQQFIQRLAALPGYGQQAPYQLLVTKIKKTVWGSCLSIPRWRCPDQDWLCDNHLEHAFRGARNRVQEYPQHEATWDIQTILTQDPHASH